MRSIFTLSIVVLLTTLAGNKKLFALACSPGQAEVEISINPDFSPSETSWEIKNADGVTVESGGHVDATVCLDTGICYTFYLYDSYGDGIYAPHGVKVYYDGEMIAEFSGDFGSVTSVSMGCGAGENCSSATIVTEGTYTADEMNMWYEFTPEDTGSYLISTCDLGNTCNTKIWVYDHCLGLVPTEFAEGTYTYNDDACDELAQITTILLAGRTYYIRIGDNGTSCDGLPVTWSLSYIGAPTGCTDIYACNFSPLAMEDDGSCIYSPSPDCPSGPDLVLNPANFDGGVGGWSADFTLETMNTASYDCYYEEGSFTGEGVRYVLTFGVEIDNIGDEDYHIGIAGEAPYLVYDPCHGHYHYVDYGEYKLYDSTGTEIPAGHKNGYAVMDLCGMGGYNGYDMGISAGCYDAYGKGTGGQWVDLTDVPDGKYTLVARVNPHNHQDVDGRTETNLANNWLSTCIELKRDAPGEKPDVEVIEDCVPFFDCYGEIFGTSEMDCYGICNGPMKVGDLNLDSTRYFDDVDQYIADILASSIIAGTCNDANADSDIDIYDAALVSGCSWEILGASHLISLCDMPFDETDVADTVTFSIGDFSTVYGYLDIYSYNPTDKVLGYQFTMSGIVIDSVTNMASETVGHNYRISHSANEVIALGYDEIPYDKNFEAAAIARIYFHAPEEEVCIDYITSIVNEKYHEVITAKQNACVDVTSIQENMNDNINVIVRPNPFSDNATLSFNNDIKEMYTLELLDLSGNIITSYPASAGDQFIIDRNNIAAGVYVYKLTGAVTTKTGRIVIQ